MLQLEGFYQHPGRAAREAARLSLNDGVITLNAEGQTRLLPLSEITVSEPLGTIPLTLTFTDGGRFVPHDDAVFRQWWQQRHRPGLVHRLERHRRGVLLTFLATLGAIALYIWVILPAATHLLVRIIPSGIEQRIGQQSLTLLQQSGFSEGKLSAEQQQRCQALFSTVIPVEMKSDPLPLRLKVMHTSEGPNAFMLADGTLILSDELVTIAKSDDALAAVMLHEIGHHHYRHPLYMLVRSSLISLGYMWLTGDINGVGDTLLQSAAFMHHLQFSRSMEREADEYAIREMKVQQRSLAAMAEIFQQLYDQTHSGISLPEWISTHPDMPERIKTIQQAQ